MTDFDPLLHLPRGAQHKVARHYKAIEKFHNSIGFHTEQIAHRNRDIERIIQRSKARNQLGNMVRQAFGHKHAVHLHSKGVQRAIAKHRAAIDFHQKNIHDAHARIMEHHGHIDTLLERYAKRHGIKRVIRESMGLSAALDIWVGASVEEPEFDVAVSEVAARLGLTAAVGETMDWPDEICQRLEERYGAEINDECNGGSVTPDWTLQVLEYLREQGWQRQTETDTNVVYVTEDGNVMLAIDIDGPEKGNFWVT